MIPHDPVRPARPRRDRGGMLITAMLFATGIGIALVSYLKLTTTSLKLANRTYLSTCAQNLTDAGLEEALYSFTQLDAGTAAATAFSGWTFVSSNATRTITFNLGQNTIGTVKVFVAGYDGTLSSPYVIAQTTITPIDGSPPLTKVVKVEMKKSASFSGGIIALQGLNANSQTTTFDSYDSAKDFAAYGGWSGFWADIFNWLFWWARHSSGNSDQYKNSVSKGTYQAQVGVASGTCNLGSRGKIYGNLFVGSAVTPPSASQVTGTITTNYTLTYTLPTFPTSSSVPSARVYSGSIPSTLPVSGHSAAPDGRYYYIVSNATLGTLTISQGKKVTIIGTNTKMNQGLNVNGGADCEIYLDGIIDLNGSDSIDNYNPSTKLRIYTSATSTCKVDCRSEVCASIFAPNAPMEINGSSENTGDFTGTILAKTITMKNNTSFHYDLDTVNTTFGGTFINNGVAGGTGTIRSKWLALTSTSDLAALGSLTGNFLP